MVDAIQGTYIWNVTKVECPDMLNRIYRGMMRFYVNSSTTASLENSIAALDQGTQAVGFGGDAKLPEGVSFILENQTEPYVMY